MWSAWLTLATPATSAAQDLPAARAFVAHLYRAYARGEPDYLDREAGRVFAPRLLALIRRDRATTPAGEVGVLDGDPVCDCQDADGLKVGHVAVTALGPGHARADITVRFPDGPRVISLDLAASHNAWRIADIHTHETPSLVRLLERELRRERR